MSFFKNWLVIALALGFIIRIIGITELPLYGDELTMAYDSYSILNTGRDQTGELLPLTFTMGAGRPGGYIYASLPFIAIFGILGFYKVRKNFLQKLFQFTFCPDNNTLRCLPTSIFTKRCGK